MEKVQRQCKKITLLRGDNGFGFTLRHFVVHPNENGKNTEVRPLETIFVQSVKRGSPAEKFGLKEGDRILSINGQSVSGVEYKTVVDLVKLSVDKVDLLLVSRTDDILQMAYPASVLPSKVDKTRPTLDPAVRKQRPYRDPPGYYNLRTEPQQEQKHQQKRSANKNNSNRIEFAQFQRNYYDTLDSAYSTGESSYNTVDSSYTQHTTSDYGSIGSRWKEPTIKQEPPDIQRLRHPGSAFEVVVPHSDKLQYADDLNTSGSDTATETETDTEAPQSHRGYTEEDMSYVPDYVRPVLGSPVSVSTVTSPTMSYSTSRPVQTSTLTSPSTSVTSSNFTSPTTSIKDGSANEEVLSPRGNSLYKRNTRNTSYAGYREDYVRKQKDVLCGRKSLEERVKSLESGAAVKLQVSKGSQKRRRRGGPTSSSDVTPTNPPENSPFSVMGRSTNNSSEKSVKRDLQFEPASRKAPQPDIIESHQPRVISTDQADSSIKEVNVQTPNAAKPQRPYSPPSQSTDAQINPMIEAPAKNKNLEPICIKWNIASPPTRRKGSLKMDEAPDSAVDKLEESEVTENSVNLETSPEPQATRKFGWKAPSAEAMNRLKDQKEEEIIEPTTVIEEPHVEVTVATTEVDTPVVTEVPKVQLRSPGRNAPLQRSGAPPPLILDVTTDNAVVPVELRSPRGEGGAFPRPNMRGKRNARVFVLPSSDDSEADNILSNLKSNVEPKLIHVAPVKFVPSVLRRRNKDGSKEDASSSASSSINDVASSGRDVTDTPADVPSPDHRETRRKSSRSPKRSSGKPHSSSRSRSAHDQAPPNSHKHARHPSSDSQPSSTSEKKREHKYSSNSKSHSNTKQIEARQPSSPRTKSKYNDDYIELTNTRRTTPRSMRKFQGQTNLPSPRQQAVAHAVKFGFPVNDGVIPYIDDAINPDEPQATGNHRAHAAESADPEVIRRALPLSRGSKRGRMRRRKSRSPSRRTSYMEAMESSEDLTPDPDTDGSTYSILRTTSGKDYRLSKFGRSNSADSILSTVEPLQKVVTRRVKRSNSADRNSVKAIHRRSYQIATNPTVALHTEDDHLRTPAHKRQPSIRKLKNFFGESGEKTPQIVEAQVDEGRRGSRARFIQPVPTLDLNEYDDTVVREGFLFFKVATIEKGKRTSSQRLWKTIWVVLKEQMLYLCKDWSRAKQETSSAVMNGSPHNTSSSQPPNQLVLEEEEPLNIRGSLVSIAYNYLKKKNVFKVTTSIGSEYLFQADDRDDMLAWINSIQVSGNHDNEDGEVVINEDLILRKTNQIESGPKTDKRTGRKSRSPKTIRRAQVPIKDVDGSRRFKWRGSVNRIVRKFGQGQTLMQGQTFDVHLEDCPPSPNNECVPYVVELCCRVVEERGLTFTGIYRVPGNSGTLVALQDELNCKGPDNIDLDSDERFLELNVISSLLKSFFRKLPDPLFTNELYDDFITMNRKKDSEERLNGLRRLIHMLPAPHYETLKFLVAHLKRVADNADVNKMEVRNLAIVFGPTLVRSTISDNMATMVTDMSDQCRIVESVLQHAVWFFAEGNDEKEANLVPLPPPPSEEHHEPVPNINHLLANVGRTPGDESDSTESSKSKNSLEKESFSRDVMDMIFGMGKRWLNNQQTRKDGASESDDEYGFKEAERKQTRAVLEQKFKSDDLAEENEIPQTGSYQVAKAAASELRAARASQDQHLPHDIQSRLYDFYVEHLERLARTEVSRLPPQFTSSSETSPQITPRHSNIYAPAPQIQRPLRRSSDSKDSLTPKEPPKRQWSSPPSSPPRNLRHLPPPHTGPVLYGDSPLNRRYNRNPPSTELQGALATSTPMHGETAGKSAPAKRGNLSELSSISKEDVRSDESDSDTSIFVGETLEEKLKNLTNLDKKLERRPSRRYARPGTNETTRDASAKGKQLANQPNINSEPGGKKSTRELYQERRAMRQQQREQVKASRGTGKGTRRQTNGAMTRCASDENVFQRCDPKRQHIRSPVAIEEKQRQRPHTDRVRRRHTLGGNDFPGQDFWEESDTQKQQDQIYGSLQNVSATSRLKPRVQPPKHTGERPIGHWRVDLTSLRSKHRQNAKKSESYI